MFIKYEIRHIKLDFLKRKSFRTIIEERQQPQDAARL